MNFIYHLLPLWLWILVSLPVLLWILKGCRRDEFQRNSAKGVAWAAFWVLGYMLYRLNY